MSNTTQEVKASKVYRNGSLITMDSANRFAEALAVLGEKILAVGTDQEIEGYIGQDTQVIDLGGKTLLPGFYDSHGHISGASTMWSEMAILNCPPIGSMITIDDVIGALKAKEVNSAGMISGWGYDDTLIQEKRPLSRYDLDKVSLDVPVYAAHISGHLGYVNSAFLNKFGITKDTPNPEGGVIVKDPVTGEPTGQLEEIAAMMYMHGLLAFKDNMDVIAAGTMKYAATGVTTASDGGSDLTTMPIIFKAAHQGALNTRIVLNPFIHVGEDILAKLETIKNFPTDTNMVTIGGIKIVHDGSLQGYTGYLTKPYHIPFKGDTEYRGYPFTTRVKLVEHVKNLQKEGCQILIHGNGDAAIDDILCAYKEAQEHYPGTDNRHVIIHAQTSREDQLDLMQELKVIPSFFVLHTYYWGDRHKAIFLGPERAARISPAQSALDRGLIITIHCDTPVVPQTPLLCIWSAVNRQTYEGEILGPEFRISVTEALRSYTINAACQNFEEGIKGSLEPGKLADLVILDKNPLDVEPLQIRDIQVLETIVGGKTVYIKDAF